jgi:hypothetical protein
VVARTRLNVAVCVHCLSCLFVEMNIFVVLDYVYGDSVLRP